MKVGALSPVAAAPAGGWPNRLISHSRAPPLQGARRDPPALPQTWQGDGTGKTNPAAGWCFPLHRKAQSCQPPARRRRWGSSERGAPRLPMTKDRMEGTLGLREERRELLSFPPRPRPLNVPPPASRTYNGLRHILAAVPTLVLPRLRQLRPLPALAAARAPPILPRHRSRLVAQEKQQGSG